jgi:hypothetical protein
MDKKQPLIGHYLAEGAGAAFVLDRSTANPRLKFDHDPEILELRWRPAANGDRILVRDDDAVILRVTAFGGITLFERLSRNGAAAAYDRPAMPLEAPPPPIETVREAANTASAMLREEASAKVLFEADWARAASDAGARAVLFDAVRNSAAAFQRFVLYPAAKETIRTGVARVRFVVSGQPNVSFKKPILTIGYAIDQGLAGRFSSARMEAEFAAALRK